MSSNFSKYLLAVMLTALVVGGGTYWIIKDKADKDAAVLQNNIDTLNTEVTALKKPSTDESKNDVEIDVPSDWKRLESVPSGSITLTGEDKDNNFTITIFVSKDTSNMFSCSNVFKDSEELSFTSPLPGQASKTNLTFTSMFLSPEKQTICDVVVTGEFKAKKGVSIETQNPTLLSSLPVYKVQAHISNTDSGTNFPLAETVFASHKYAELITALKSIQVK